MWPPWVTCSEVVDGVGKGGNIYAGRMWEVSQHLRENGRIEGVAGEEDEWVFGSVIVQHGLKARGAADGLDLSDGEERCQQ